MTHAEIKTMLASVGVPTAYYQFPEDTGQQPPFICFFYNYNNDFLADDTNYQKIEHLIVELYTDNKDFELEAAVEAALSLHGLVYTRDEEYLGSEQMYEVVYEMDVVITEPAAGPTAAETEEQSNG